jgi:predicted small metal-binding protein
LAPLLSQVPRLWLSGTVASRGISRKGAGMKVMTCEQLGGPCDFELRGTTADEVIKAQDRHLKEMVTGGDTAHEGALKEMKGRWKRPISGMGWYRRVKRDFAALPED